MRARSTKLLAKSTTVTRPKTLCKSVDMKAEESEASVSLSGHDMDSIFIKQEEKSVKFENYNNNEQRNTSRVRKPVCFSCKHCKLKFLTQSLNDAHMKEQHNLDPRNRDCYCQPCKYKYLSRSAFRRHLHLVHKMKFPTLVSKLNPNIQPDPNDSDSYCKSCDSKYKDKAKYRYHLRQVHKMKFPLLKPKPNSGINPDLNDLDLYCKSCNLNYVKRGSFLRHLRHVHKKIYMIM